MNRIQALPTWQKAIVVAATAVMILAAIAALNWGRSILIPLALALMLSFLLSPLVMMVQRRGLRRTPSVVLVMLASIAVIGCTAWIVVPQVAKFTSEIPHYAQNLQGRMDRLQENLAARGETRLAKMVGEVSQQLGLEARNDVVHESPAWLRHLLTFLSPLAEVLGQVGLAVILAFFILLKKEDLRNRIIRLAGHSRLAVTTKAIDEAAPRISRFLLTQFLINASFGVALGIGLVALGVEHALLWAFLAAVLRYVPYIGSWIGAAPAIFISLVASDGWWQPLAVVGLFLVLEAGCVNLLEPWLLGHSLGVSEVSQLMAVACWAFLWGPMGLVLSGPMTVCLLVLAKYVPELHFLTILLGDAPALDPASALYQRLAARDQDEAAGIIRQELRETPADRIYDSLLIPALTYAMEDREKDGLSDEDTRYIHQAMREVMEDVIPTSAGENVAAATPKLRLVAYPARAGADGIALEMLGRLLDPRTWTLEVMTANSLASELVDSVATENPAVTILAALPPGGLTHARYLCKRLRMQCPDVHVVVGRWGAQGDSTEAIAALVQAGADHVDVSLLDTVRYLRNRRAVLAQATDGAAAELQEALA